MNCILNSYKDCFILFMVRKNIASASITNLNKLTIIRLKFNGILLVITSQIRKVMKKIIIIDGGPRKNMNTAKLLQRFAEGAKSASNDVEVKTIRLYELDYKGCMSCMACKLKGKAQNICRFKDALTPLLEEIAKADGLVLGSPIYFGEVTGQMRAFLERLAFPWLS